MPFISWLLGPILIVAAVMAAWFVSEDSANFGVVQMAIAVLLIAAILALVTFWRDILDWFRGRQ